MDGYIALRPDTYRGFVILRSNFKSRSDADIRSAVEHGKRVKVYPLGGDPGSTVFVDADDKPFDATIPHDASFFELLHRFVQAEPWITRDKVKIVAWASAQPAIARVWATCPSDNRASASVLRKAGLLLEARLEGWESRPQVGEVAGA